jgi:hemerythrin-like domain-containing protein
VAVILNALRALRGPARHDAVSAGTEQMLRRFAAEHDELRVALAQVRDAADRLVAGRDAQALEALRRAHTFLTDRLLPHEHAEESRLYPALTRPLGSAEAVAPMSRTHAEIDRLATRIGTHLRLAEDDGQIDADQVDDLLACLYGLHALLRLHFVQEEETYFVLAEDRTQPVGPDGAHESAAPPSTPRSTGRWTPRRGT